MIKIDIVKTSIGKSVLLEEERLSPDLVIKSIEVAEDDGAIALTVEFNNAPLVKVGSDA